MRDKIKKYEPKARELLTLIQDVRALGMIMFGVIALMITWSGVKVIETNYTLQRSISQLEQENAVRELENRNLELENQYFESDEYLELEARKNFGLAAPGETVWVVPKAVALRYTIPPEQSNEPAVVAKEELPTYRRNLNAWTDFLFYRNRPDN
jgi:cell division protein FtsB